jgi:phosphoglucomutase
MCGHDIIEDDAIDVYESADSNQKNFSYDYGKTFFRNLYEMLVNINAKKRKDRLKK